MSMLDRIRDGFKYLDKNGLKHLIEKIKLHDVHWTGTHAEYEAQKDTIPAYAILHFTDDYEDSVGVVDKIEDNNMNGVTSNAVAECFRESSGLATLTSFPTYGQVGWYRVGRIVHVDLSTLTVPAQTQDTILATGLPRPPTPMTGTVAYIGAEGTSGGYAKPICVLTDGSLVTNGGTGPAGQLHGGFNYIAAE